MVGVAISLRREPVFDIGLPINRQAWKSVEGTTQEVAYEKYVEACIRVRQFRQITVVSLIQGYLLVGSQETRPTRRQALHR
jgi:hypothetical protein